MGKYFECPGEMWHDQVPRLPYALPEKEKAELDGSNGRKRRVSSDPLNDSNHILFWKALETDPKMPACRKRSQDGLMAE